MKRSKLTDVIVRSTVSKIVRDMQNNPERGVMKLLEYGKKMSANKTHKDFLVVAEQELKSKDSAYYKLIERVFSGTDRTQLIEIGMSLGYNAVLGGTKSASHRQSKPWTIFFDMSWRSYPSHRIVENYLRQGVDMGIYCYLFHIDKKYSEYDALFELFSRFSDCTFILFIYTPSITKKLISQMRALKNTVVFLKIEDNESDDTSAAARLLVESKCLCGGFTRYSSQSRPPRDDSFMKVAEKLGLPFMCMICSEKLRPDSGDGMKRLINRFRMELKTPVFPIDLWSDIAEMGAALGWGACLVTVSGADQVIVTDMDRHMNKGGIDLGKPLADIIKEYLSVTKE